MSPPIETDVEPSTLTPRAVIERDASGVASGADPDADPEIVLWGGTLLDTRVLDDGTQLEVLAHPLDRRQRPMSGRASQGRFLIVVDRFLEPLDYAPGRQVSVLGALAGVREGMIGEARVRYPVVRPEALHLWSGEGGTDERPRFTFGLGISLGN